MHENTSTPFNSIIIECTLRKIIIMILIDMFVENHTRIRVCTKAIICTSYGSTTFVILKHKLIQLWMSFRWEIYSSILRVQIGLNSILKQNQPHSCISLDYYDCDKKDIFTWWAYNILTTRNAAPRSTAFCCMLEPSGSKKNNDLYNKYIHRPW